LIHETACTGEFHKGIDWVVKNLRVRKSVHATLTYLLSHVGLAHGILPTGNLPKRLLFETVVWFGSAAYNKLKMPEKEPLPEWCPLCEDGIPASQWSELDWVGQGPPPDWAEREIQELLPSQWARKVVDRTGGYFYTDVWYVPLSVESEA
jgi:hypothetical protein